MYGVQATRRAGSLKLYLPLLLVAALVVALDQLTKELALAALSDGPVDIVHEVLSLRLTFNPGGAFGLLQDLPELFLVATIAVVVLVLLWAPKLQEPRLMVPLGLVLGGGVGNLVDRLVRPYGGGVVDFIDLHVWPVFNFADMSIVAGVGLLLLWSLEDGRSAQTNDEREPKPESG